MSRGLKATAAFALAVLLAAGCAKGSATRESAPDGKSTIRYFTFSAAPDHLADLDKIIKAFEAANPSVTVTVETAPYADYFTKLQTAIAGNTAPDTFELNYESFVAYAASGALADLSGEAAKDDLSVYAAKSLDTFKRDGRQLALPASYSAVLLFYNKDLFDKAGLPHPTADWTWDQEMAAAKKLTGKGVYGDFQPVQFFEFYKALAQAGGAFFSDDGKRATFNSPQGVAAAKHLLDKPGTVMPTVAQIGGTPDYDTNLFKQGKLAMWHNGIWQFAGLKDVPFQWDVVVEPAPVKASAVFTNAVAVSPGAKNPAAAYKWLRFLTASDVTARTRIDSSWELPPLADAKAYAGYFDQGPPANRRAILDAVASATSPPVIVRQQEMQDTVTKALEQAAAGKTPIQKALDDAAAKVDELIKQA
ncbi:sugar ABC transporter substrate-binding protein [Sphaerisporangium album]|uniref:Sugar ABC transporter substrate-binding protein n=1 Tax=Sphaerisporangium album TaxID=509200 RepID=A0A367EU87_9ACTN|nr:sugar ABC transporter substrate-binding protein [Sphaerisporangium album]RCG20967.1 sugar ABC transporter substrate-binding protein [Sphaerisporangium album]